MARLPLTLRLGPLLALKAVEVVVVRGVAQVFNGYVRRILVLRAGVFQRQLLRLYSGHTRPTRLLLGATLIGLRPARVSMRGRGLRQGGFGRCRTQSFHGLHFVSIC